TRILSGASVAEMAKDQTTGSFDPIHSDTWAYGLGWDSVSQPGLAAVGFDGWAKGGDSLDYHAALVVSPQAQLGIVVLADSGPGWTPYGSPLKYRSDGWFASDQDPLKAFKVVDADLLGVPTQYILNRAPAGYGHYLDNSVFAQRLRRRPGNLSAAWQARLSSTWLVVNE